MQVRCKSILSNFHVNTFCMQDPFHFSRRASETNARFGSFRDLDDQIQLRLAELVHEEDEQGSVRAFECYLLITCFTCYFCLYHYLAWDSVITEEPTGIKLTAGCA